MSQDPSDPLAGCGTAQVPDEPIRTAQHTLRLLPGMEPILAAICGDVDAARSRVSIETYIFRDDKLGRAFGDALARAAARGVRTRLIYDPLGSQETDSRFFDELAARGVEVRAYRPAKLVLGEGSVWPRDHSRVIVVDDAAYTGGAAWGDEWLPKKYGGKGWHDVCMSARGPIVEDFQRLFEQRWREANAELAKTDDYTTQGKYPDIELVGDSPEGTNRVYDRFREAVRAAKERIWIENSYFFPPYHLLAELYDAAARGVDVQVIVPSESDLMSIKRAARSEMPRWIEKGLRIWEYQPCMVHSKFALVDGDFAMVGTFNMNPTSVELANEVCLFVYDPAFVARVARLFEADREQSAEVTREQLAALPIGQQILDRLANDALSLADRLVDPSS